MNKNTKNLQIKIKKTLDKAFFINKKIHKIKLSTGVDNLVFICG